MSDIDLIRAGTWALHVLDLAGFNDSDAADAIRDAMSKPWRRLTEDEQQVLRAEAARVVGGGVGGAELPTGQS